MRSITHNPFFQYRPEIDGLRAIAVIAVVLFHAGVPIVSGGFIGVDVFFVISGYLITSILLREHEIGRFSLLKFYERRVRRIFPALFLVLFTASILAWFYLLPEDMVEYSNSLLSSIFFISNIYFSQDIGYFATASEYKPLLHTWTLSLEEQYYIFFPIFLWGIWKYCRNRHTKKYALLLACLLLAAIISFVIACWLASRYQSYNFYLLPSRGWEFLAGAICAIWRARSGYSVPSLPIANILSISGVVMIAAAAISYNESIPFPSYYTLLPVLGTALVIMFGIPKTFVHYVLAARLPVFIGLISYSTYLWHYTLFAFYRIYTQQEAMMEGLLLLSGLSIILGYFSWKYVEAPFRKKDYVSAKILLIWSVLVVGLMSLFAVIGIWKDGYQQLRFSKEEQETLLSIKRENLDSCVNLECNLNHIKKSDVVLLGDSNAYHFSVYLSELLGKQETALLNATLGGCPPILGIALQTANERERTRCYKHNHIVWEYLQTTGSPDTIIVSAAWELYVYGDMMRYSDDFANYDANQFIDLKHPHVQEKERVKYVLGRIKSQLLSMATLGKKIYLFYPMPYLKYELPRNLQALISGPKPYPLVKFLKANKALIETLDQVARHPSVTAIRPYGVLCPKVGKTTLCVGKQGRTILYGDRTHLSAQGSRIVYKEIFEQIVDKIAVENY